MTGYNQVNEDNVDIALHIMEVQKGYIVAERAALIKDILTIYRGEE